MAKKHVLIDHGGNELTGRFGAAAVKRALSSPVSIKSDGPKDYSMVRCDDPDVYITRDGKTARKCSYTVIWWAPDITKQEFDQPEQDKAIAKFLRLCKKASTDGHSSSSDEASEYEGASS